MGNNLIKNFMLVLYRWDHDTHNNDIQHNDAQHDRLDCDTQQKMYSA